MGGRENANRDPARLGSAGTEFHAFDSSVASTSFFSTRPLTINSTGTPDADRSSRCAVRLNALRCDVSAWARRNLTTYTRKRNPLGVVLHTQLVLTPTFLKLPNAWHLIVSRLRKGLQTSKGFGAMTFATPVPTRSQQEQSAASSNPAIEADNSPKTDQRDGLPES